MSKKIADLKEYPTPWHLEGPYDFDGLCWGSDIAIVAANGECVMSQWGKGGDWAQTAKYLVNLANQNAGLDCPVRLPKNKLPKERMLKSAGGIL